MIRLIETSPVQIAWAEYDAAALRLQRVYAAVDPVTDNVADRLRRMQMSVEVLRLWRDFQDLFLCDGSDLDPAA